jgi:hypothetical protein
MFVELQSRHFGVVVGEGCGLLLTEFVTVS